MDNLCHSLAGAALAECGFAARTRYATSTLVIGANLPDVDVISLLFGDLAGLEFRRGWTHGLLAMAVLPLLLLGAVLLRERWRSRRGRESDPPPALNVRVLLVGGAIAVWSHPVLDWLNTYGVRFLMPFSERWFYGDTLFIVDLVLLALFGTGWWLSRASRRRGEPHSSRPARAAVTVALLYVLLMHVQTHRSATAVEKTLGIGRADERELMIAPLPVRAFVRMAHVTTDSGYVLRQVRAGLPNVPVREVVEFVPTRQHEPLSRSAQATDDYRRFARWSRLPYFIPAPDGDSNVVFVGDARYARGSGETWAGAKIRLSR